MGSISARSIPSEKTSPKILKHTKRKSKNEKHELAARHHVGTNVTNSADNSTQQNAENVE